MFKSVAVAVLLLMAVPAGSGAAVPKKNFDNFARCLTAKKATFYGVFYCVHCADQRELFGSAFRFVPYVECAIPGKRELTFACSSAGIKEFPTWIFADGTRQQRVMTLQELSKKTGCPLP